jgi:hypothetical protein
MIKKTIISAFLFFVAYNLFLAFGHPYPGPGQHQWQKNIILMQDYADYHTNDPVVIVGTSLSARLYNYMLPQGYYNLALAGGSIFEGLAAVKLSPKKPKYLLIETNIFYKDPDKEAMTGIFDPTMVTLRKWVPSFREANQPVNLLTPYFSKKGVADKPEKAGNNAAIAAMLINQRIKEYQVVPKDESMNRNTKLLQEYIIWFEGRGVKVILYEIPMNCKLLETPRYMVPKQKITELLPPARYTWMPMADCKAYQYSDGSHMEYESAADFVKWFVGAFENVKQH